MKHDNDRVIPESEEEWSDINHLLEKVTYNLNYLADTYAEAYHVQPEEAAMIMVNICLRYASDLAVKTRMLFLGGDPSEEKWIYAAVSHFDSAIENNKNLKSFSKGLFDLSKGTPDKVIKHSNGWNSACPRCIASKFTCDEHFEESDSDFKETVKSEWNSICSPGTEL